MCRKRNCKRKSHEGVDLILCPACLEVKHAVLHHLNPQCHFNPERVHQNYPWLFCCADCHRELHDIYPQERLHPEDYLLMTREFLLFKRGEI